MKIIEQGSGWSIEMRCTGGGNGDGGCNSLLQVEREDVYLTSSTDYTGDTDYYYTFRCPVCDVETDIPEKLLPSMVKRKLLEEKKNTVRSYGMH